MNDRLAEVPWDLAQDEIGIQVTDFIATTAKVVLQAAQDEIARQVAEWPKDRVLPADMRRSAAMTPA
jgi:hypothetical protein